MAETLGEALLVLRTDDSAFSGGVDRAETKAEALGSTLDKATASSDKLAVELTAAGRAAAGAGSGLDRYTRAANDVDGAHKRVGASGMIMMHVVRGSADQFAAGAPVTQIFAQHLAMVGEAAAMSGGQLGALGAFLSSGWGLALMAGVTVLITLIGRMHDAADEAKQLESDMKQAAKGADGFGDAQSLLGQIMDLTTGKMREQNDVLKAMIRLQAILAKQKAQGDIETSSKAAIEEANSRVATNSFGSFTPGGTSIGQIQTRLKSADAQQLVQGVLDRGNAIVAGSAKLDTLGLDSAIKKLGELRDAGKVDADQFRELTKQLGTFGKSIVSGQASQDVLDALDGKGLAPELRKPGRKTRTKKPPKDRSAQIDKQFDDQLTQYAQQSLSAMQQVATSADEEAEYQLRSAELARLRALNAVDDNKDFNAAQKKRLKAEIDEAADRQREAIEFKKQRRLEQEAQQLAEQRYRAQSDALHLQFDLADTEAKRKAIALQILAADDAYLKAKLEAVIASQTASDAEKKNAQAALDALVATAGVRQQGVAQANETTVEKYLREIRKSPAQINEAIDQIKIEGLQQLNGDLADAILRTKSLGQVFHDVAKMILRDLLQIAIQRAVIAPLANALFPTGGGPANLLAGTGMGGGGGLFGAIGKALGIAGARAGGGSVGSGMPYLVGERGPELFVPGSSGTIVPNGALGRAPAVVELRVAAGELFEPTVSRISGDVAIKTVQATAPTIRDAAVAETARMLSRPRI